MSSPADSGLEGVSEVLCSVLSDVGSVSVCCSPCLRRIGLEDHITLVHHILRRKVFLD